MGFKDCHLGQLWGFKDCYLGQLTRDIFRDINA